MFGAKFIALRTCWPTNFIEEAEMPCDELPDDLKVLWKESGANPSMFSLDQLRKETNRIQAGRRRGHIVLGGCMLLLVAGYGLSFFLPFHHTLARIGATLSVLVCGYWLTHALVERARVVGDFGETDGVRFYRAELEHVRDNHRWMFRRWLLLPIPFILFDIGCAQMYAKLSPFIVPFVCFDCALLVAIFAIWAPVKHSRLARKYQDRIDALDAAVRSGGQPDRKD
jgi:hypothetical protein